MSTVFLVTFFIIALVYSSIGFGGGSSYIAFMFLFNTPFEHITVIALVCNLIVVSGGTIHYIKNKQVSFKLILPFIITSIPASYFAGLIQIPKDLFKPILGVCLFVASIRMFIKSKEFSSSNHILAPRVFVSGFVGLILGFVSGLVGIGGGIFLSPIMYNLKWGRPKQIASTCAIFILFNSIAGLVGQLQKESSVVTILDYWQLFIVVFVGGQIGSYLSSRKLEPRYIQLLTSLLILFVSLRILFFS